MGVKLITRLRLGLSHLIEHRFHHNFENCLNPLCTCSLEVESTTHFFLYCHHFNTIRIIRNNSLKAIDKDIPKVSDSFLTKVIIYGDSEYSDIQNHCKWSLLKLQTSHRRLQTTTDESQATTDESQTSHRWLRTSHRRVTSDNRRVTYNYRRIFP